MEETNEASNMIRFIIFIVHTGDFKIQTLFGEIETLAVNVLLRTTFF